MQEELKILFDEFNEKPIAYHRVYSKITGSITSGLLLSQLIYWAKVMKYKEFYKTDKDFCDELGMGLYELRSAKKKLKELGIITTKRKGVPAKTYYQVKPNIVIKLITRLGKNPQLEWGKTHNKSEEKPTTITETISETTSETKTAKPSFAVKPIKEFSYKEKIKTMLEDKNKHIQIIAYYWFYRNIIFKNEEQYKSGIKRYLRPASTLKGYELDKIKETMYWLNGTEIDWGLETVGKYIDKDLKELREKGGIFYGGEDDLKDNN